ncbi:MAG: hypothetical protein IIA17_04805 [candidate division Zixibacteria bacterium]|nr:hypothetical protein [candidate division Zixibacteria bacterium]
MEGITMRRTAGENSSPFWNSFILPILRYKRMTYVIVTTSTILTLGYCLIVPNQYTSVATILPSGGNNQLSELKDLAGGSLSELGLGSLMQASENSSAIYPKILSSRLISERILGQTFAFTHKGEAKSMTLLDYTEAANSDKALLKLNKIVGINLDRRTGFITLSATTTYPELSAKVVHSYLDHLEDYNINHRQSKAKENERFIASRLTESKKDLSKAESELETFRNKNLNYMTSQDPALQKELSGIEREVTVKEAIFLTLTKKHELAKLESVKDVPIVQVLDKGSVPITKTSPKRSLYMMAAFIGSLFMSVLLSLWFDISVKRGFRTNLERVIQSPGIEMGRIESRIATKATWLASLLDEPGRQIGSDKVSEHEER